MCFQRAVFSVLLAACPGVALAHTGHEPAAGFAAGLAHPMTGADHLLAMLAVGLLAAQLGGRALLSLPLAFLGVMALGAWLGTAGLGLPVVEAGILASVVVLGALLACGRPLPQSLALSLVAAFALLHGQAHGAGMPAATDPLAYGAGFLLTTAGLHGLGMALGASLARTGGLAPLRYVGGAIVLGGLGLAVA